MFLGNCVKEKSKKMLKQDNFKLQNYKNKNYTFQLVAAVPKNTIPISNDLSNLKVHPTTAPPPKINTKTFYRNRFNKCHSKAQQHTMNESMKDSPPNISDDVRVSKILRRLHTEESVSGWVELCKKLDIALRIPANVAYITRSFENLLEYVHGALKKCPSICFTQFCSLIGLFAYIGRGSFLAYEDFIRKNYKTNEHIQKQIALTLQSVLSYDITNRHLERHSETIICLLKDFIEHVDTGDIFIIISSAIITFSKIFPYTFENHFTDVVDIIVGWHLEMKESKYVREHCSYVLQEFAPFFSNRINFTYGLLIQIFEDIHVPNEKITSEFPLGVIPVDAKDEVVNLSDETKSAFDSIGGFFGAFISIFKTLLRFPHFNFGEPSEGYMRQALKIGSEVLLRLLSTNEVKCEAINSINELFCFCHVHNFKPVDEIDLERVLQLELKQLPKFDEEKKLGILYLTLCFVQRQRSNVKIEFVKLLFNPEELGCHRLQKYLNLLKLNIYGKSYKLVMRLYQEVLLIKNVPLLQEAYSHLIYDINSCIEAVTTNKLAETDDSGTMEIEARLNFNLSALSALATQAASIIAMYACKPSILDLLITNCCADKFEIWVNNPTIHHSIIITLIAHCETNHNYRNSSRLLQTVAVASSSSSGGLSERTSPTAENFITILRFMARSLELADIINKETLSVLLKWILNVLKESKENATPLLRNNHFITICKAVGGGHVVELAPRQCGLCIEVLLTYEGIGSDLLILYRDTTLKQLDKLDNSLHSLFSGIYASLPLNITLHLNLSKDQQLQGDVWHNYRIMQNILRVRERFFKLFLDTVEDIHDKRLIQTLENCFSERVFTEPSDKDQVEKFVAHTSNSSRMLIAWMQFELGSYLVEQKLRSTVGKAQDTFLAIEAIIKKYAVAMKNLDGDHAAQQTHSSIDFLYTQRNMRFLLGFLEALEKLVYNAAEGTAFAYNPPEKPIRSFFRLNTSTCQSWFTRIIPAIQMLGINCMEPESVIRYSEQMLTTVNPNDVHFTRSLVYMSWALLACNESDTLQGLALLARSKTGKRHYWIQMAAEQAAGHKETAINGYKTLLSDGDLDDFVRQFIIAQLQDCLVYTAQWSSLREFKQNLPPDDGNQFNTFTQTKNAYLSKLVEIMTNYELSTLNNDELQKGLYDMTVWPDFTKPRAKRTISSSSSSSSSSTTVTSNNLTTVNLIETIENHCVDQLLTKSDSDLYLPDCLQNTLELSWRDAMLSKSAAAQYRNDIIVLKYLTNALKRNYDFCNMNPNDMMPAFTTSQSTASTIVASGSVLIKCLSWSEILERRRAKTATQGLNSLYLDVAEIARKEGNYECCQSMLTRFFVRRNCALPLHMISGKLINDLNYKVDIADNELLRGYNEIAQWLFVQEKPTESESINLIASLCYRMHEKRSESTEISNYSNISSSMLLKLSDWLTLRFNQNPIVDNPILPRLMGLLPCLPLSDSPSIPDSDKLIGQLLNASLSQYEIFDEAWLAYGNWCYRWGKKIVETRSNDNSSLLSTTDIDQIKNIVGDEDATDTNFIYQLIAKLNNHTNDTQTEEIDMSEDYSSSTELLRKELQNFSFLKDKPATVIEDIIVIWRKANKGIYEYYEASARAYLHYLMRKSACSSTSEDANSNNVPGSTVVAATLRLLRLIVKHAVALQDILEEGLRMTPIQPWKVIIPQLFSRLNHHEPYVRKSVSDLLCRLAKNTPHLVIFPAVVGANRELTTLVETTRAKEQTQMLEASKSTSNHLNNSFSSLLSSLSKDAQQTVFHVELLVKELRRICLLWDEYWIHSLAHIYTKYLPRINAIGTEFSADDIEGKTKKFNTFREQIVNDLEQVASFTARPAETTYENVFKKRFDPEIKETIEMMSTANLPDAWGRLKQLYTFLTQNTIRGVCSYLKMQNLSPVLANMSNTDISMPGVNLYEQESIYIRGVESIIRVLPTKTKPKKVAFLGSNGKKYTFLFKGHEDLHLDERIMQFLSIANAMMACNSQNTGPNRDFYFQARHYSVIPLGAQAGLISWVDGVIPIFGVYKKWQQRQSQIKLETKKRSENENTAKTANNNTNVAQGTAAVAGDGAAPAAAAAELIAPTKRLTELFYGKLAPLLAKHNMKVTDPRKQWPLSALKQVLSELALETPRDLLVRELWANSVDIATYRQAIRRYTSSLAVMSVIGYIIGLGDRHLDNMLINLFTGEIVHIDYNVCFEKGKTLRIPEKVPFRMTQNLIEALGITGIEGSFRLGCEYVMRVLRKERETLLTLLETFVYDPLVDWTLGEDTTGNKAISTTAMTTTKNKELSDKPQSGSVANGKKQDWEQSFQHVSKKIGDIKNTWSEYSHNITTSLKNIERNVKDLLTGVGDLQVFELELSCVVKQSALVREIETLGSARSSHTFNTAAQRYKVKNQNAEALRLELADAKTEYTLTKQTVSVYEDLTQNRSTLAELKDKLFQLKYDLNFSLNDWYSEYNLVCEVLPQSLKELTGYHYVRLELNEICLRSLNTALDCVDELSQYASVAKFYQVAYLKQNPYLLFNYTFTSYANQKQQLQQQEQEEQPMCSPETGFLNFEIWQNDNGNAIESKQALEALYKMEKVWLELKHELRQTTMELENAEMRPINSKDTAIQLFNSLENHVRSKMSLVFGQMIQATSLIFVKFEKGLLENEDRLLVAEQLEFVNIVCTLMNMTSIANERLKHFTNLQATLKTLLSFRELFIFELPQYIFRLFFTSQSSRKSLEKYSVMGPDKLQNEYEKVLGKENDVIEKSLFEGRKNEYDFFSVLHKIIKHFQHFKSTMEQLKYTAQITWNRLGDETFKQKMKINLINQKLDDLKLEGLFEVIHKCLLIAPEYDVRSFAVPINSFITIIERNYIIGLIPLFAFDTWSVTLGAETYREVKGDTELNLLASNFFTSMEHNLLITQLHRRIHYTTELMNCIKATSSALFWSNENMLHSNFNGHIIQRELLLDAIYKNTSSLPTLIESILNRQDKLIELVSVIEKEKSDWNQNHIESLIRRKNNQQQFAETVIESMKQVDKIAKAVYLMEKYALTHDQTNSLTKIEAWNNAYSRWQHSQGSITPVEEAIVELLNPEGDIDQAWVLDVMALLEEETYVKHRKISDLQSKLQIKLEQMHKAANNFKKILDATKISEMRYLMNIISKCERNGKNLLTLPTRLRDIQISMKTCCTQISELRQAVLDIHDCTKKDKLEELQEKLNVSLLKSNDIKELNESFAAIQECLQHIDELKALPLDQQSLINKTAINPNEQKRNAYGVSVWKKIRMKLEGRDPDPNQRSNITDQVDYIISEATNVDNLAVLYEGWTPWV